MYDNGTQVKTVMRLAKGPALMQLAFSASRAGANAERTEPVADPSTNQATANAVQRVEKQTAEFQQRLAEARQEVVENGNEAELDARRLNAVIRALVRANVVTHKTDFRLRRKDWREVY